MQPVVAPAARLSETDICDALSRTVGSAIFRASPKLTAFLRFVVERSLAGEGARIKGYTIAIEALGRGANFDPQIDPIVRVEAGRLRRRLARYYADEGLDDPVMIELPSGSYVPRFAWRAASDRPAIDTPDRTDDGLDAALWRLIGLYRRQLQAMACELALVEQMLDRSRAGNRASAKNASACRPSSALLPPRGIATDAETPADGRQIEQDQQVESAAAARAR